MSDLRRTIPILVRAALGVDLRLIDPVGDDSFFLTLVFWICHMRVLNDSSWATSGNALILCSVIPAAFQGALPDACVSRHSTQHRGAILS